MHQNAFGGWTHWGSLQRSPTRPHPLAKLKGRGRTEWEMGGRRKGRGDGRGSEGEKERGGPPMSEVH